MEIMVYHGSSEVVQRPEFGKGNEHNDFGRGFYCTEESELAREWACSSERGGFCNRYSMDIDGLSVMRLASGGYNILNWLAILLENRVFRISSQIELAAKEYLLAGFLPEYRQFDVMVGYRANDSYFSFARAFLSNTLTLEQLEHAMYLGKLGEQVVLKSEAAFRAIQYLDHEPVDHSQFYPKRMERDRTARTAYRAETESGSIADAVYMVDILRGGWKNDDPRIRRIVR